MILRMSLIGLTASIRMEFNEDGSIANETILSSSIPGMDLTLDSLLGPSPMFRLGEYMKGYPSIPLWR